MKLFSGSPYGEPAGVTDGGPWHGPTMEEWVFRVSAPSTPAGETIPWIKIVDRIEVIGDNARAKGARTNAAINAMRLEKMP